MMFKATVKKLVDLEWSDLRNLFAFPGTDKYRIQTESPHLLVAKASDENGEAVAYLTAENILLVDGYAFNPKSTPEESRLAGDAIDRALAQRAGAQKIWIVVPANCPPIEGEQILRVVERKVFQPVTTTPRVDSVHNFGPTQFLN